MFYLNSSSLYLQFSVALSTLATPPWALLLLFLFKWFLNFQFHELPSLLYHRLPQNQKCCKCFQLRKSSSTSLNVCVSIHVSMCLCVCNPCWNSDLLIEFRMFQNVPECSSVLHHVPECSKMHAGSWACIQDHELACSYINLYAAT